LVSYAIIDYVSEIDYFSSVRACPGLVVELVIELVETLSRRTVRW
jgi:hypothetical protein